MSASVMASARFGGAWPGWVGEGAAARAVPANVTRLLLLADLCRGLGERGCPSYLVNPASGGAVLRVGRAVSGMLAVAAAERAGGWVCAWGGRWADVRHVDRVAAHLAGTAAA
ncbi:hypothetical protein EDD29_1253 [Actinocorallia herbida]|uniref:Uncharacterized protein n=1 Tax=Actinocorallia herbida TaxID=58109 RepID=A0A3N1CRG6_9ACTN|nr:hypothetical protein [Actinocorallia herbida]ROO83744.1 hypothetical protein EDD29_1253 [Actinocorallia herbida]